MLMMGYNALEATMVAGVDVVHCDTRSMQADTSPGPSNQTSVVIEGTIAEVSTT